jgi:3,4-dihydroxy 2-butanone 4-phosphate synthase/GTP cyclohydrolase II
MAGLQPAAVIIEVMNEDGTMARRDDLLRLCAKHQLKICTVAEVISQRLRRDRLVERVAESPFDNDLGTFRLIAYRSRVDPMPHVALVCGEIGQLDTAGEPVEVPEPVLVRMHSQNLLGDVFGDASQPSGRTLRQAMRMIQEAGRGAIVYLRHEGMGSGLLKQLQTAALEADDPPTDDDERVKFGQSQATPGISPPRDKADYGIGSQILRDLGLRRLRLITHHPFHPTALSGFGLQIEQFVPPTDPPGEG